jgi:Leucine-rich repeat (LRR) protein
MSEIRKKDAIDKKATKLNLKDKKLKDSDSIFTELASLSELTELDLSGNLLATLPEDVLRLKKIQSLDITNNPFTNVKFFLNLV